MIVQKYKGFTLVEILLVITLLSILLGIVIFAINPSNIISEVNDNQREADAMTIYQALEQYSLKNNEYPEGIKNMPNNTSSYICKTSATSCNSWSQVNLSSILVPTYISKIPEYSTDANNSGFYVVKDSNGKIGIGGIKQTNNMTFVKGLEGQSFVTKPIYIDCNNPTKNGLLAWGVTANGVTISIPYIDGSGQAYSQQEVTSTGVTGLTATLSSGSFANGSGNLVFNITGTPSAVGVINFNTTINGNSCSLATNSTTPPMVTNGLVLNLDAGNPASYPGTGTTWTDLSGNNNNGTLVNGVGYNSANGGSLVFDGLNDYVSVPFNSDFAFGTGDYTVEVWMNMSSFTNNYQILLGTHLGGTGSSGWYYYARNALQSNVAGGQLFGYTTDVQNNQPAILLNTSYQMVARRINGVLTFYQNIIEGRSISFTDNIVNGSSLIIGNLGGQGFPSTYALAGSIPIVRIYKGRGLTQAEIQQNFNATKDRFGL